MPRKPRRGAGRWRPRTAQRPQPALLVLQLDSSRLRADGLALAGFAKSIRSACLDATVDFVEATTRRDLLDRLASLAGQGRTFDVIVAVGHSNESGIVVAADDLATWDAFAAYLKPFEPRRLVLVACQAGRWPAAQILFRRLRRLRRIYASPTNISGQLGTLMVALIPFVLHVKAPSDDIVLKAQLALGALTGGQIRQWMRTRDMNNPDGMLLDLAAQLADPAMREVHRFITSALSGSSQ